MNKSVSLKVCSLGKNVLKENYMAITRTKFNKSTYTSSFTNDLGEGGDGHGISEKGIYSIFLL